MKPFSLYLASNKRGKDLASCLQEITAHILDGYYEVTSFISTESSFYFTENTGIILAILILCKVNQNSVLQDNQ